MANPMRKALIADDDSDLRATLQILLERESYEVFQCASYNEAHKFLISEGKAGGLDLVILDGQMPPMPEGKHGADLAEEVMSYNPSLHVVLFTSDPLTQFKDLLSKGVNMYQKPDMFEMLRGIRHSISAKKE